MTSTNDAVCLTCGGPAGPAFMTKEQPVFRCRDQACGLTFDFPQPTDAELEAAYALDYTAACTPIADAQAIVDAIVARVGSLRGRRVIDFGAGVGRLTAGLRRAGADVVAIESASEGRAQIKAELGVEVFADVAGMIEAYAGAVKPFDLIVMVEVVEHLRDPRSVLAQMHGLLMEGGWILVTTPNIRSLKFRLQGPRWSNVAETVHIVYFDARSLAATLTAAGFEDIQAIADAARHPDHPLLRRLTQRSLRPFGLSGGLQVTARKGDRRG